MIYKITFLIMAYIISVLISYLINELAYNRVEDTKAMPKIWLFPVLNLLMTLVLLGEISKY